MFECEHDPSDFSSHVHVYLNAFFRYLALHTRHCSCTLILLYTEMEPWSNNEVESVIAAAAKDLGYSQLTSSQSLVLHEYLSGKDVFVSLPTGSGKSLCYWVLPGAFDALRKTLSGESIVLVVSPLIALMKDQVAKLKAKGIDAVYVGERCDMNKAYEGRYPILFYQPRTTGN